MNLTMKFRALVMKTERSEVAKREGRKETLKSRSHSARWLPCQGRYPYLTGERIIPQAVIPNCGFRQPLGDSKNLKEYGKISEHNFNPTNLWRTNVPQRLSVGMVGNHLSGN